MSGTVRTEQQLEGLFIDNDLGDITAQDGRDLIATVFGHVATINPTADNDRVDSAGIGSFFDVGSMWLQVTSQLAWICFSGGVHTAIWQALMPYDQLAGGDLVGPLRNGSLSATGVVPGTYGDATHVGQFTVDAKGRITAAANVLISGGGGGIVGVFGQEGVKAMGGPGPNEVTLEADRILNNIAANTLILDSDRGFLKRPNTSGVIVSFTPPIFSIFANGWFAHFETVTQTSPIIFQMTAGAHFTGGGIAWLYAAGGGLLNNFNVLGGAHFYVSSDGTDYHVCGLPVCWDPSFDLNAPMIVTAGSGYQTILWEPIFLDLGPYTSHLTDAYQPGGAATPISVPFANVFDIELTVMYYVSFAAGLDSVLSSCQVSVQLNSSSGFGRVATWTIQANAGAATHDQVAYLKARWVANVGDTITATIKLVQGSLDVPTLHVGQAYLDVTARGT